MGEARKCFAGAVILRDACEFGRPQPEPASRTLNPELRDGRPVPYEP